MMPQNLTPSNLLHFVPSDDIVTALNLADEGYSDLFMMRAHPAATRQKWMVGITTLFLTGALGLAVTFMLVVTSSEVVNCKLVVCDMFSETTYVCAWVRN